MVLKSRQIKIGAILSYIGIFVSIITGIFYNPWMIKKIGNVDYGLYTLSMSLINIFLIDFGLSIAAQRFISKYRAEENQESVDNLIGLIYKLYFSVTIILSIIFAIIYFLIDDIYIKLTIFELQKFKLLYILVVICSITTFPFITLNGILSSYEKFIPLKVSDLIYKIMTVVLTILVLANGLGVYALVIINLISSILVTILRIIFIKKYTPVKVNFLYKNMKKIKELFSFSVWTFISVIISRLLICLGPTILGIVCGSFEIAVFGYAVSIEGNIYLFVNALNGFFMPRVSMIIAKSTPEQIEQKVFELMVSVGRFIFILFSFIFISFIALGQNFISLLVGKAYIQSYFCVLLVCGYGIISYPQQIANTYSIVQNKVKIRAIYSIISFIFYLFCVFPLGKLWGALGISLAIGLSLIVQTILFNFLYIKKLNINILLFFKECHLKLLPGIVIFFTIAMLISKFEIYGWSGFFLKVILIIISYLIIVWFLFFNINEKQRLLYLLIQLLKKNKEKEC